MASFLSPVRLVRNVDASRLFDTFLITSITTVLITRAYLSLAGYPQLGGASGLHIAHLLPGGLLMLVSILIMIGSINRSARDIAAFLGGIGFGLFWDELGKFITQDNNYFFKPTVGILYVSFVVLYLVTRYIIRRSYQPEDYLANTIDLIMDGAIGDLDQREYDAAKKLLAKADPKHPMYAATVMLLEQTKPSKDFTPFFLDRAVARLHRPFKKLVQKSWFTALLLWAFFAYGLAIVMMLGVLLVNTSLGSSALALLAPGAQANLIAIVSSCVSAGYIVWGSWFVQQKETYQALRRFETALLINIFVTQAFLFFRYQLTATAALFVALGALFAVRILLTETSSERS